MNIDPLSEIFDSIRLHTFLHFDVALTAPWGIEIASRQRAMFFAVSGQTCLLTLPQGEPFAVGDGDLVLLPRGGTSLWQSAAGTATIRFEQFARQHGVAPGQLIVALGAAPEATAATRVTGGAFWSSDVIAHPLLAALPALVLLRRQPDGHDWLAPVLALMRREIGAAHSGTPASLRRLTDLLLIESVRAYLQTAPQQEPGWLRGMADARLAPALQRMHAEPQRAWSLPLLAKEAALSRTLFAERFRQVTGETPLQYLTRWRMYLAARRLRESGASLEAIGEQVGYQDGAAFQKAFKRSLGIPPGEYRRRHQTRNND